MLQKYWHLIALSLFILLIASLFFWPAISDLVALAMFLYGLAVCIYFIVRRNLKARYEVTPLRITLRILIEIAVALLVVLVASLAGMQVGAWLGLLVGMAVAFGVVWVLSRLLQRLARRTA